MCGHFTWRFTTTDILFLILALVFLRLPLGSPNEDQVISHRTVSSSDLFSNEVDDDSQVCGEGMVPGTGDKII